MLGATASNSQELFQNKVAENIAQARFRQKEFVDTRNRALGINPETGLPESNSGWFLNGVKGLFSPFTNARLLATHTFTSDDTASLKEVNDQIAGHTEILRLNREQGLSYSDIRDRLNAGTIGSGSRDALRAAVGSQEGLTSIVQERSSFDNSQEKFSLQMAKARDFEKVGNHNGAIQAYEEAAKLSKGDQKSEALRLAASSINSKTWNTIGSLAEEVGNIAITPFTMGGAMGMLRMVPGLGGVVLKNSRLDFAKAQCFIIAFQNS